MNPFFDLFLLVFIGLSVGFDITEKRIPNRLILVAITGGILFNGWKGMGQLLASFLGLGLGIGILIIPFAFGWLGAGDVKFLGAVGAILGVQLVPRIFFYSAILGGVLAVIALAYNRSMSLEAVKGAWRDFMLLILSCGVVRAETVSEKNPKGRLTVPYGVAIGLATLVAFYLDPKGEWAGF